ncbi:MAG: hypothetical protein Q9217_002765 [Psora testacea]
MANSQAMPVSELQTQTQMNGDLTDHVDKSPARTLNGDEADLEKQLPNAITPHEGSYVGLPPKPLKDPNLIDFEDLDDSVYPLNWTKGRKWMITIVFAVMTLGVTFTSSIFSTAATVTAYKYNVGTEVTVLGTSLFVLGFAFGPIVWGPLSELYGRRLPLLLGVFGMSVLQVGVAVAQNLYTIFLCRFFAGLFGSSTLAVIAGALADFWDPVQRGPALGLFSIMTFAGPVLGPVVGGFIVDSYLGWRWTEWITVFLGFFSFALGFICLPETYHPLILQNNARRLRHETKNWALHSKADEEHISPRVIAEQYLFRPFKMFWMEPILVLITLYMGLVYGILYLFFIAFPISFSEERGWNLGVGALPFLSILIGVILGGAFIGKWSKSTYLPKFEKTGGRVPPEERLPPMAVGGVVITVGLFWWAWSSYPDVHRLWVSQCFAGIPIGAGVLIIFVQGLSYLVDCYKWIANSAIAASTFFRSLLGAGFPLFAAAMYHKLGVQWATTLLAFLCMALIPVPIVFYKFGHRIRGMSKFVPNVGT